MQHQQDPAVQSYQYPSMQDSPFSNTAAAVAATTASSNDGLASYRNPLTTTTNDASVPYDSLTSLDPAFYNSPLNGIQQQSYPAALTAPQQTASTQLVRRDVNQQLARTPQRNQWAFTNSNHGVPEGRVWENMDDDEEQDIDTKAAQAKKDAQAKRKQIPPFVQKLSR